MEFVLQSEMPCEPFWNMELPVFRQTSIITGCFTLKFRLDMPVTEGSAVAILFCCGIFWTADMPKSQFRSRKFCKRTVDSPSHRIFGRMHEALNIDKK
jgi:hypothetical protein